LIPSRFRQSPYGLLLVFIVLKRHRRELLHFNVTEHPTAASTSQQIIEALPIGMRRGISSRQG
jgi:hypothetical protein